MTRLAILLLLCSPAWAISIADVAGIFSIAASSGSIVKEGKGAFTHPIKLIKHHGQVLKDAAKSKPAPPPPAPMHEGKN